MLIEAEISSPELIRQLLMHHSPEYLFHCIAELEGHDMPEDFAIKVNKMLVG